MDERWYKGMSLMLFTYAMVRFLAVYIYKLLWRNKIYI
jgi:hypothetical protein